MPQASCIMQKNKADLYGSPVLRSASIWSPPPPPPLRAGVTYN